MGRITSSRCPAKAGWKGSIAHQPTARAGGKLKGANSFAITWAEGYTGRIIARPQFSLRWLFAVTAAAAVMLGEAVAFPGWIAWAVGIAVTPLLACAFVAGIVYARGYGQAFCIGALVWWLAARWIMDVSFGVPTLNSEIANMHGLHLSGYALADHLPRLDMLGGEYRIDYCVLWLLMTAGGFVAVVVRWLTRGGGGDSPPRSGERV
jgi:hypothetical protein